MRISASFHHDFRRDSLSSDTARETTRKISFKPTSRRSSHLQSGQDRPAHAERSSALCRTFAQVAQVFGTLRRLQVALSAAGYGLTRTLAAASQLVARGEDTRVAAP